MKFLNKLSIVPAVLCTAFSGYAADGLEILHLGTNNTLVRVTGTAHYILLPVQESIPDAVVDVIVDGNTEKTFYVRLASSNVDYFVPFDLSPYSEKEVLLNVVSHSDRTGTREASDNVCWDEMALSETFDDANREKYRPAYHHTPRYGWMNDPNGMFYKDGVWHLYFQHNPYGAKWQNMTWGHSVSDDLVHWTQQPNAIEPNGLGAVFSGSSVVDTENTAGFGKDKVVAIYTSAGLSQIQSLAHSDDDGMTFSFYNGSPIITTEREARDPNMFWNEDIKKWNLVLANALEHEMLIYSSPDLKKWTLESSFGKGFGSQDGVWECPDLMKLPVRGTNEEKWVLICNINPGGPFGGSATQYFVGDFNGKEFVCDTPAEKAKWMDYGKDHYATVSWSNAPENRHTVIGWMSNWQYANEVPTMQFRSANTLPRDLELFQAPDGDLYLSVKPSPEVDALRGAKKSYGPVSVSEKARAYNLPSENDGICEILLDVDLKKAQKLDILLSNKKGEKVAMHYDAAMQTFAMDRKKSGLVQFSQHFPAVTVAPVHGEGNRCKLRIFIDRCSIEAFEEDGKFAMTNLVFPTEPYNAISISTEKGKARVESLEIYSINPSK